MSDSDDESGNGVDPSFSHQVHDKVEADTQKGYEEGSTPSALGISWHHHIWKADKESLGAQLTLKNTILHYLHTLVSRYTTASETCLSHITNYF